MFNWVKHHSFHCLCRLYIMFQKKKSKSSFETRLKNCYRGENIEEQNQNQAQVFSNVWGIESHLNMYTDQNLIIQKL